MRRLHTVLFLLAFTISLGSAAQTYRWVDDDGVVHYSDAPNPASQDPESDKIEIRAPNVIRSQPTAPSTPGRVSRQDTASEEEAEQPQAFGYQAIRVVSPGAEETLWNIGGTLTINLQVTPALRPDHGFVVYLDGKLLQTDPVASTTITVNEVYRGEHTVRAAVRSTSGAEFIASDTVTFHVRQSTAN